MSTRTHGMVQMYWAGCRCKECGEANKSYNRSYVATEKGKLAKDRAGKKFRSSTYGKLDQKRRDLKRYFNLSLEEYNERLEIQNGVCAICKGLCNSGRRLAVDHDHITGKVRGLLCGSCNTGLGRFRDNVNFLENAISYIKDSS